MISNVHGKPRTIKWKKIKLVVLPMYHPAAALRNGDIKFKFKRDFEQIPEILKDEGGEDDTIAKEDESEQMSLV